MANEIAQLMTGTGIGEMSSEKLAVFTGIMIWSLIWKGLGLWHAALRKQQWWFVAILLLNTFGVLEIIYLLLVLRIRFSQLFNKDVNTAA